MASLVSVLQIILGIILVALILLQTKGSGLGSTFGGSIGFYATKRGAEKMLFILTIAVASLFLIIAIIRIFIST